METNRKTFRLTEGSLYAIRRIQEENKIKTENEAINFVLESFRSLQSEFFELQENYQAAADGREKAWEETKRIRERFEMIREAMFPEYPGIIERLTDSICKHERKVETVVNQFEAIRTRNPDFLIPDFRDTIQNLQFQIDALKMKVTAKKAGEDPDQLMAGVESDSKKEADPGTGSAKVTAKTKP
jgi:hypothetical protein